MNKNEVIHTLFSVWGPNKTLSVGLISIATFMVAAGVCALVIPNDEIKENK